MTSGPVAETWQAVNCCRMAGAAPSEYWLRRQLKDALVTALA